jgi:phenylalanine-4-hydroxylase
MTKLLNRRSCFTTALFRVVHRTYVSNSGQSIPYVKYTQEEIATWKVIYKELNKLHITYGCKEFNENYEELKTHCNYRYE